MTIETDQGIGRTVVIKGRFALAVSPVIVVFANCLLSSTLHWVSDLALGIGILHNRHNQPLVNPARRSPVAT